MQVNDLKDLFPRFEVDTYQHVLGHVSKAVGKLHGLEGDTDHIKEAEPKTRWSEAFAEAEKANGKAARAYIADLVICAAKLAELCPSGEFDLAQAIAERMEEKRSYRDQYAKRG